MAITKQLFGRLPDNREVERYLLTNPNGMRVAILTLGGAIQEISVPDKNGRMDNVICAFDELDSYWKCPGQHGALIGRFGNRIAKGRFVLDGVAYTLATNNGQNHLHGGLQGYHHKIWAATLKDGEEPSLTLQYISPDMEEGYPGTLTVTVTYTLTKHNAISIHYVATTDKKTVVNLTNHAYFNLGGLAGGNVLSHVLWMDADTYLPVDEGKIPTGELRDVSGTPFDFRRPMAVGKGMQAAGCFDCAAGYDHCFNFTGGESKQPVLRATLSHPENGRVMKMYTDQPCVQLYTGNHLGSHPFPFSGGNAQCKHGGICLETQKMPDSPNRAAFTDATLLPGEVYDYTTVYEFSVQE